MRTPPHFRSDGGISRDRCVALSVVTTRYLDLLQPRILLQLLQMTRAIFTLCSRTAAAGFLTSCTLTFDLSPALYTR